MSYPNWSKRYAIPAIVQEIKEINLNFENEESIKHHKRASEDLYAAKALLNQSNSTDDEFKKKAYNRKAKQSAMESVEHSQKSFAYADNEDNYKFIKTHDNINLQKELDKNGIYNLTQEDMNKLHSGINRPFIRNRNDRRKQSYYNSIRFEEQNITNEEVEEGIKIAEKSLNNIEKKIRENQKNKIIQIDNLKFSFEQ